MTPPHPATASPWRKAVVALFVSFLVFGRQMASWTHEVNRYFSEWRRTDALAIFADVAVVAAAVLAVELLLARRDGRVRRLWRHLFLVVFVFGLLSCVPWTALPAWTHARLLVRFGWLIAALVALVSWFRPKLRLPARAVTLCLVFSPMMPLVFVQMVGWTDWGEGRMEPYLHGPLARRTPVFFFVFDEWSYQRSTRGGEFRSDLPNLAGLARGSVFFRAARSAGHDTEISLPRTIYQTTDELETAGGRAAWRHGAALQAADSTPSLFTLARRRGYRTSMLGFYLPYGKILGSQVDFCRAYRLDPGGGTLAQDMLETAVRNLRYSPDPLSRAVSPALFAHDFSAHWRRVNLDVEDDADSILADAPPNTFAIFHWPLPHAPFVFNPDGSYAGPFEPTEDYSEGYNHGTAEGYERQLKYMDAVVGRLVKRLRDSGKFDAAMLVLTSDHSWRREPDPALMAASAHCRWVPLLVKLPGEKAGHVVDAVFPTTRLREAIERVLEGRADEDSIVKLFLAAPAARTRDIAPTGSPRSASP